ncbi:MAG: phosphomannomutase/phosphoglucomutase [Candidatus Dadabacteria bacterium]|nr:MAG: phosphomannomutase/phosphoglucomutase [Candidatus Dadabacteria bacterium]
MELAPHIFRKYDIRGIVGKEITAEFAYYLGRGFAEILRKDGRKEAAVGRDCRLSSDELSKALSEGLQAEGIKVISIGVCPTPQLYFTLFYKKVEAGIQVTGSHNPPDMNGFKLCIGEETLAGEQVQAVREAVERAIKKGRDLDRNATEETLEGIKDEYINYIISNCKPFMGDRTVKVVLDAGNGVGGLVGPQVLRGLGCEVEELYCEPDGRFPNHHPDPTVMKNIEDLKRKVVEIGADVGIGFDGDADRIGVVNEKGEVIYGDMLLLIYARYILEKEKGITVIGDVKCSDLLFSEVEKAGGRAIMWKTGHSLIKHKLREENAELAGEMSGHIFFKHRYFGFDDAIYSAARLVEILSRTSLPLSKLLADVPRRVSTPEIRIEFPEDKKFQVVEEAEALFSEYELIKIDGVRIKFPEGWGLIRASNTQPALVLRFEASTKEKLKEYQETVYKKLSTLAEIENWGF